MNKRSTTHHVTSDVGPFAIVPLWIVDAVADTSNGARAIQVFAALHRWTNADRSCYPSLGKIAEAVNVNVATVRRAIQTLEDVGAISVTGRVLEGTKERTSNLYHLCYVRPLVQVGGDIDDMTSLHVSEEGSLHGCARNQIKFEPDPPNQINTVGEIVHEAEIVPSWESSFMAFWKQYPRKKNKQQAMKAWRKMTDSERDLAIAALPAHVEHWRTGKVEEQYIPHGSTWLNGKRWEDELVSDYKPQGSLVEQISRYALTQRRQDSNEHSGHDDSPRGLGSGDDRLE